MKFSKQQKEDLLIAFLKIQATHFGYTRDEDILLNSEHPQIIFIRNIAHELIQEVEAKIDGTISTRANSLQVGKDVNTWSALEG